MIARIVVVLLALLGSALAGGRGGHVTTFDSNLYGGASNVACITAAVAGVCATGYNATCNGVVSDATPWANWVAAATAASPALAVLYVPPGKTCVLDGTGTNGGLTFIRTTGAAGPKNVVIWGYGAKVTGVIAAGGFGFFQNNTNNALLTNTSAGASAVTLVTASDASIFSVGDWAVVSALGIQTFGYPANWHFFEFKVITAITGTTTKTIALDSPLTNSYKTTYPRLDTGGAFQMDLGGPAMIYKMEPSWNTNVQIFGLTLDTVGGAGVASVGRQIIYNDVVIPNGIGPTAGVAHWFFGSNIEAVEVDKQIERLMFYRVSAAQVQVQSSSVISFNVISSRFRTSLNGTAKNTFVTNTSINAGINHGLRAGPTCCGHASALTLEGVSVSAALNEFHHALLATMTYSAGTFTIAKSSPDYAASISLFVPGFTYYIGDNAGSVENCTVNKLTVTDVIEAGANIQIVTDLVGAFPSITCGGVLSTVGGNGSIGAYQAETLAQKFSGPANLLSNPEMLPP